MLLLIVDDANSFSKKELYAQRLDANGVMHVNTLNEAEEILNDKEIDLLVINNVLVEDINYQIDELKKLNDMFSGSLILKVDDENVGLKLLKQKVITEYYLSDNDKNVEFNNLKKAYKLASMKSNIHKDLINIRQELQKLKR